MTKNSSGEGQDDGFEVQGLQGIDPELVPYLLEAQSADESGGGEDLSDLSEKDDDQDEDLERLRSLVRDHLLAGADPELIEAVLRGELAGDESEPGDDRDALVDEAQAQAELAVIYQGLLKRTNEHNFDPSTKRVAQALFVLGDPQDAYPIIHVTGTNGKTSTTRLASALLSGFGLRCGTFTSPHLIDVRERIQVNGQALSAGEFVAAWEDVAPYIDMVDQQSDDGSRISYFEALTITALAVFADIPVDVAVVEVGLGGQFDATNVAHAGVSVMTPISIDHTKYLGDSLESIAREKVRIVEPKSIVVVSKQEPDALAVIESYCAEVDALVRLEGRDWSVVSRQSGVGGQLVSIQTPAALYEDLFVPLHGEHQAQNAACALVAVEAMTGGRALPEEVVEQGFLQARSPGRLEVVRTSPTVIVDAAHNPAGVAAMRAGLEDAFSLNYVVGVFTAMGDKDIELMLVEAESVLDQIVLTELPGDRAAEIDDLYEIAVDVFGEDRVHQRSDVTEALDEAARLVDMPTDPSLHRAIVAFGSIQLAGRVKALFGR